MTTTTAPDWIRPATFDDPMVNPASAATAERILRALDGEA